MVSGSQTGAGDSRMDGEGMRLPGAVLSMGNTRYFECMVGSRVEAGV